MIERPRRELGKLLEEARSLGDQIESGSPAPAAVATLLGVLGEVNQRLAFLIALPPEAREQLVEAGYAEILTDIQRKDEPLPEVAWGDIEWKIRRRGGRVEGAELIFPDDYPKEPEKGKDKKEGGAG